MKPYSTETKWGRGRGTGFLPVTTMAHFQEPSPERQELPRFRCPPHRQPEAPYYRFLRDMRRAAKRGKSSGAATPNSQTTNPQTETLSNNSDT